MARSRVVVAMSGGVDSSVAALLLAREGYQVIGVTLRLWTLERPDAPIGQRGCCSVEDTDDARRVCQTIGIPHYVVNAEREFRAFVVDYFLREYQRGRTPHPCIACNDRIKFDFLLQRALALDADFVATGHYARVLHVHGGQTRLLRATDPRKDQSYVLFGLAPEQLRRVLFPVGGYAKEQVRDLARKATLPVADKPDSQEICFIPQGDYREFLRSFMDPKPGEVVDSASRVLGRHPGVEFFTVGQRRRLGVASSEPLYVLRIEPDSGRVVVGAEEELYCQALRAQRVTWTVGAPPKHPMELMVKVRYKAPEVPATVTPETDGALVRFREPQRAVTPGQAAVFYQGEEVLGGGFIQEAIPARGTRAVAP